MKKLTLLFIALILSSISIAQPQNPSTPSGKKETVLEKKESAQKESSKKENYKESEPVKPWKMIWREEFNAKKVNLKNWDTIARGTAHWNRYMSTNKDLIKQQKGNLILTGMPTPAGDSDTSKYVTGGLYSIGKFSFQYGRIDICAKVESAQGAWPALWLLPDVEGRKWPDQGEIDIMEHLNFDDFVYQTLHSNYTVTHGIKDNPPHGGTGKIDKNDYNVYSVEWGPEKIVWLINDEPTFEYKKLNDKEALAKGHWPFDEPFYIVLSQQLGGPGTWVGEINDEDLPIKMYIDYIRVYQL